jgi:hypothetical protein
VGITKSSPEYGKKENEVAVVGEGASPHTGVRGGVPRGLRDWLLVTSGHVRV